MSDARFSGLLSATAALAEQYLAALPDRPVRALLSSEELHRLLGGPLPREATPAARVIETLAAAGLSGTTASTGPRYFGFVTGGTVPAGLAADWLVSAWDQNAGVYVMSPLAAVVEQIAAGWLKEIVGLPKEMSVGFTTGCQMASFTALAAARHRVLARAGWDVEGAGLFGAPPIDVLVNDESHFTIFMALRHLGLGSSRLRRVPADSQGRMKAQALEAALADGTGPCIVCAQAGNVNSGAFDPLEEIAALARRRGAWLHVDGAFGLWASAAPSTAKLLAGIERADSIATDGHKWLNVPYDCGIVFCGDEAAHRTAMSLAAPYIVATNRQRDPHEFVPEESRRARGVPLYAVLRSLGRDGLAEIVERHCRQARRFAERLRAAGCEILNEVVLNQVVVVFGDEERTRQVIAAIQEDGTCWCGGTVWKGRAAMRISVCNWSTTDQDIERSIEAILRVAGARAETS